MQIAHAQKNIHPVFEKYTIQFLATTTGYRPEYLHMIRRGAKPASSKFRRLVALALAEPEEALFIPNPVDGHADD